MQKSPNKTKVVIDTNILLSAAIKPNSTAAKALYRAVTECDIFISQATFGELAEVIQRNKFDPYFTNTEYTRLEFLTRFFALCIQVPITHPITDCIDPKDNKFLEVALASGASILVSGDKKHLLSMNPYHGVQIITAAAFLAESATS
ncbi:MAG: putative toxin-antitoxin system toxin component, PIN family [Gallionella sp.]|nr:putative toxin-antitoxin system toxin component, PIN family [Gallionella sp.]MDD4959578.1 putative toxin-antitoxin system toxin component, PIN family [Gallionella sp.]